MKLKRDIESAASSQLCTQIIPKLSGWITFKLFTNSPRSVPQGKFEGAFEFLLHE